MGRLRVPVGRVREVCVLVRRGGAGARVQLCVHLHVFCVHFGMIAVVASIRVVSVMLSLLGYTGIRGLQLSVHGFSCNFRGFRCRL